MGFGRSCLVLAVTLLAWNTWDFAPDVTPPAQRLARMGVKERTVKGRWADGTGGRFAIRVLDLYQPAISTNSKDSKTNTLKMVMVF